MDLDNFKDVNDEFGHAAGDEVLIQVAARLKNSVRQHDTLARMSGDEFTLLLEGVETIADVEKIIQKIDQRMEIPFEVSGKSLRVGVSIGISLYPHDGDSVEKGFVMLNIYVGFRLAAERASHGDYAGSLTVLQPLRANVEQWLSTHDDEDIEDDLLYIDLFIQNLQAQGGTTMSPNPVPPEPPTPTV